MIEYSDIEIKLLDVHGSDSDIYKSARLSYDGFEESDPTENMEGLIRYLWFHNHTSPFEQVTVRFYLKIPIFIMRQLVRHRTASLNELSRRYRSEDLEFFKPEFRKKDNSLTNQGSGEVDNSWDYEVEKLLLLTIDTFNEMIDNDISAETAREILPVNLMTKIVWQINLRNFFHFYELRSSPHAQKEIQNLADVMFKQVFYHVPISCGAFMDKRALNKITSSKDVYDVYKTKDEQKIKSMMTAQRILTKR